MKFKEAFELALSNGEELNKTNSKIIAFLDKPLEKVMIKMSLNEDDLIDEGIHFVDAWYCGISVINTDCIEAESYGAESYEEFISRCAPFTDEILFEAEFIVYSGDEIESFTGWKEDLIFNCF